MFHPDILALHAMLSRTHALLTHGWCQHAFARTATGDSTLTSDPLATRWSLVGALWQAVVEAQQPLLFSALVFELRLFLPHAYAPTLQGMIDYNNALMTTQDMVLALVAKARDRNAPDTDEHEHA